MRQLLLTAFILAPDLHIPRLNFRRPVEVRGRGLYVPKGFMCQAAAKEALCVLRIQQQGLASVPECARVIRKLQRRLR